MHRRFGSMHRRFGSRWLRPWVGAAAVLVLASVSTSVQATESSSASSPDKPVTVLPTVVVEGKRIPGSLPGAHTVLDQAWLLRRDAFRVSEVLQTVPGLRMRNLGGMGAYASLRGLGSDRVAVLLDGQPWNLAQGGGVDLSSFELDGVERVEVVRGASGALYGSHALGGAINLVSRQKKRSHFRLRTTASDLGRFQEKADWRLSRDRWQGTLRGDWERQPKDLNRDDRTSENWSLGTRLSHTPAWAGKLEAAGSWRVQHRASPGTAAFPTPQANLEDRVGTFGLGLHGLEGLGGVWQANASLLSHHRSFADPAAPLGAIRDRHENKQLRVALRHATPTEALVTRAEVVRSELDSSTDGNRSRNQAALSLEGRERTENTELSAVLRGDTQEGFTPWLSGRLALWQNLSVDEDASAPLRLRVSGGYSERPPSFDDLFWPARASAAGNPNLEPESSWDAELGVRFEPSTWMFDASAYWQRVQDYIQWVPGADGVWRPHNLARASIHGLELEGRGNFGPLYANTAYTWLRARDAGDSPVTRDKQLVGRAEHQWTSELQLFEGAWQFLVGMRATGRAPLTAANTKWHDGYMLFHSRVSREVAPWLRVDVEMQNIGDTDHEDIRGYETLGRELLLSLRIQP